jgi:curli production assembly/transport component CsgG
LVLVASCTSHAKLISPCLTNPEGDYKDLVSIVGKAQCFSKDAFINLPITQEILDIPKPKTQPIVAVYKFGDFTGQRKSVDGYANFSTAMTQAPETYLIRALKQSGFFRVVERVNIDHITRERQIIRSTREKFEDETEQLPLLFAGLIIEGGIVDYNTNLRTGGAGARTLGIGRVVSVSTGEILLENLTTRTILSVGISSDVFRFTNNSTELIEFETGNAMNESKSIALQSAIEIGIVDIVKQGRERNFWEYYDE